MIDHILYEVDIRTKSFQKWKPLQGKMGIYLIRKNKKVLYVGRSIDLAHRLQHHKKPSGMLGVIDYDRIEFTFCNNTVEIEIELIKKYQPHYNIKESLTAYYGATQEKRMSITLPKIDYEKIKGLSAKNNISLKQIGSNAIRHYLEYLDRSGRTA